MSTQQPDMTEPERRARAIRAVAGVAHDADDLRSLLDMLGLDPGETVPHEHPAPARRHGERGIPMTDLTAMLATADPQRHSV
ncbi:MAG TPA: hypothetical protein VJ870_17255 [Amycolatopsis sp.]|nr:hypothetical protein [Amycolatopsis sp.]